MDNVKDFFHHSHYNIIRILLSVCGLWPFHSTDRRHTIYFAILLVVGSGLMFEVLGLIEVLHDSFEVIDCLPELLYSIMTLIKLMCMVYTLPKLKILLLRMQKYHCSSESHEETEIMFSHTMHGRKLGYGYAGLIYIHSAAFLSATLSRKFIHVKSSDNIGSNKTHTIREGLPYHANYFVDVDIYFIPIFIHTAFCEVYYTTLIIACDVLYLTLIEHSCGLFAALRYRLENVLKPKSKRVASTTILMRKHSYLNLIHSAQKHADAIQFVNLLESVYTLPLLVHIGVLMLLISLVGYQMIKNTEDTNHMLKYASYLSALSMNLFFHGWQGQKIINCSEKVYESIYNIEWYNMPIAHRKIILMIMIRSKTPLAITAGKITEMSYITCNAVLRASSSYFMLLRSL